MGIGVRTGTPHPDIGTPAALRKTLLAVKAVTFSDPGTGAASGVHTVKIFEQLGIADEMKPKYRLGDGTSSGRMVVSGEAELAIWQISAMKPVKGLDVVGPLPAELQLTTHLSAVRRRRRHRARRGQGVDRIFRIARSRRRDAGQGSGARRRL